MGLKNRTTGMEPPAEAIQEVEGDYENEIEAKPEDFFNCNNSCGK